MRDYEKKLQEFMDAKGIKGEFLSFSQSCHSVEEAAEAVGAPADAFVKNICVVDGDRLIVAIVKGEDRASTTRIAKALGIERPRIATPEEILMKTGYPCGGTPSFGYGAIFLVDERVVEKETVYTGGGSTQALVLVGTSELLRANQGTVCRIRK